MTLDIEDVKGQGLCSLNMADANLKKQQMEYLSIGILVLVAIVIGLTKFQKKDRDDELFSRTAFNEKWKEVEILEAKVPKEEKGADFSVYIEREPFKNPFEEQKIEAVASDVTLPAMTFQGMVWDSTRPQVIINNKVYDVSDTIVMGAEDGGDKVKIIDIKKEGIYLKYKGKAFIARPK